MDLEYLNGIYNGASEELKNSPAFYSELKGIEGMIRQCKKNPDYKFVNVKEKMEGNKIEVELYYTYGGYDKEKASRTANIFSISLDKDGNLFREKKCASVYSDSKEHVFSNMNFFIESSLLKKDSKQVIEKRMTGNLLDSYVPINKNAISLPKFRGDLCNFDFEWSDKRLKSSFMNLEYQPKWGCWFEWSANRISETQAFTNENLIINEADYHDKVCIFHKDASLTGPDYDVMRIDSYGDVYTGHVCGGPMNFTTEKAMEILEAKNNYNFSGGRGR